MDGVTKLNQFLAIHKVQLEASGVPQTFWPSLYKKLKNEIFDAGEAMQLLLIDYDEDAEDDVETRPVFSLIVALENGIKRDDPNAIFLIDHTWTFRLNEARQQLEQYDQLKERLAAIMGIDMEEENCINNILKRMWKYCHAYSINSDNLSDEARLPIWYIMDEVGSAVLHADNPNFCLVPFLDLETRITYSILFPIRDIECGEHVTRDFVEYVPKEAPERTALLLPWRNADLRNVTFTQTEPGVEYFTSGHIPESYLEYTQQQEPEITGNSPLKVFAEYEVLREHLNVASFELVANEEVADILWLSYHFKEFAELAQSTPNKYVNQFPYEYVITIKDLLSISCRRAIQGRAHHDSESLETYPKWLPTTYNLKTELAQFVSYYQHRADKGLDNHWIVKPWNLARGMDTHITNNLKQIVRLPATGPKIAQKYIENPVLFYRPELNTKVKFDIRYVILLKSVQPLEAYVHRKFFLRFSNKEFSLENFDDYEKHFTVMNYQENSDLRHIKCDDFLNYWQEQYPGQSWSIVENKICEMLHEVLVCASKFAPPCGIAPNKQSRALYAADIMLEWTNNSTMEIQPKLLEINWTPDCKRACDYYPDFFNDIFKLLFLNEKNDECFRLLTETCEE